MKDASPHQPIGQQLRQFRLASGLSQEALAASSGVSVRTISDLERGQRRSAHLEMIRLLASALGLPDGERHRLLKSALLDGFTTDAPLAAFPLASPESL